MQPIKWTIRAVIAVMLLSLILNACKPIKNMSTMPKTWQGNQLTGNGQLQYDRSKKTVIVIADYRLTEMFDMLAPYNLFNRTEQANVFIVAKDLTPILVRKDLFIQPQLTFNQVDSMQIQPDVIVIPALSVRNAQQDTVVTNWIRSHYLDHTNLLAVCDGASTAAATGLYDGANITCHASDIAGIKANFQRPLWVQHVSVTKAGRLYSTAGVSNAVEGSLSVIRDVFGDETMKSVKNSVKYPYADIRTEHSSNAVNGRHKMTAMKKIFFRKNKDLGVSVADGVDEFTLATVLDTYGRTFPASITTFTGKDSVVTTRYGLKLIFTGQQDPRVIDELHVLAGNNFTDGVPRGFEHATIVRYNNAGSEYLFNVCLARIRQQYGKSFERLVKISLDYN